jgi:hypothetical protein
MSASVGRGVAVLVWLAGCGGALKGGGQPGSGGGSIATGRAGAIGSDGAVEPAGQGGIGAAGLAGATGGCPTAPATNDPECHPEDTGLWSAGFPVPALGGDCPPGLTCEIPVGTSNSCAQALGLQTYVCCPTIFPNVTFGPVVPMPSGFVPGATIDACPQPIPGQDPACALPLTATCSAEGLTCSYQSAFGAGSDAGCFLCSTRSYQIVCCGGVWIYGFSCAEDAGVD